jgi:hypothetical protein
MANCEKQIMKLEKKSAFRLEASIRYQCSYGAHTNEIYQQSTTAALKVSDFSNKGSWVQIHIKAWILSVISLRL